MADTLGRLATLFAILSLFGFGGGSAIIPQMHAEAVDHYHWITSAQFAQYYALGRLAPGPTTTMSALVGYAVAGVPGAIVAALAMFVPASVVTAMVGLGWTKLAAHPARAAIAAGIAPVVLGLVWAASWTLTRGAVINPTTAVLAVAVFALTLRTKVNVTLIILAAGVIGAALL